MTLLREKRGLLSLGGGHFVNRWVFFVVRRVDGFRLEDDKRKRPGGGR
jgi:hypothetical protein